MGIIFDIQRCSYHDGPGVRATVFLKGCGLRCAWCHNPESFQMNPQLQFINKFCTLCRRCEGVCPNGAHQFMEGKHTVDFSKCTACGKCADACTNDALTIIGREASVEEIMAIVRRDRAYYEASGGGMTVSGGEPTTQGAFLSQLLAAAKSENIHTCLETNGYIPKQTLESIAANVDLFLLDFKLTDDEGLKPYTLASGALWQHTMDTLTALNKPVILRLPMIPGINATREHLQTAVEYRRNHPNIQKIEIMPYHSIGAAKWEQLGLTYSLPDIPTVSPETAAEWNRWLREME